MLGRTRSPQPGRTREARARGAGFALRRAALLLLQYTRFGDAFSKSSVQLGSATAVTGGGTCPRAHALTPACGLLPIHSGPERGFLIGPLHAPAAAARRAV
jgi:hypothetical protein